MTDVSVTDFSTPATPVDESTGFPGRRISVTSSSTEGTGVSEGVTWPQRTLKRKFGTDLRPLYIPLKEEDLAPRITSAEFPEPHPGDEMIVDSDKPQWTPSIRVAVTGRMTSFASHFTPSRTSSSTTLVDEIRSPPSIDMQISSAPNSALTPASGCDIYGWEEGLEQKLSLESQAQTEVGSTTPGQKCAYGQPKPRGLFQRVFAPKF